MTASDSLTIIIADSSRIGTYTLEKILSPCVNVRICRDDAQFNQAISQSPLPRLCLISYQWPDINNQLTRLSEAAQPIPALLLASPESDPNALAQLNEQYGAELLYRPYEPKQVLREVLKQLAMRQSFSRPTTPAAKQPPEQPGAQQATTNPVNSSSPLDTLERDRAFCYRHALPLSLMALDIQNFQRLEEEVGEDNCLEAQRSLQQALTGKLRQEDTLLINEPGRLVLVLPGTPPLGAQVLAHRICAWLQKEEFSVDDFRVNLAIAVGIHCLTPNGQESAAQALEKTVETAQSAYTDDGSNNIALSNTADERAKQDATSEPSLQTLNEEAQAKARAEEQQKADAYQIWKQLEAMLNKQQAQSRDARQAVLHRLTEMLRLFDENERMQLVDELLLASSLPD